MAIKLLLTCFAVLMLANISAIEGSKRELKNGGFYGMTPERVQTLSQRKQKRGHLCPDKETDWISEENSDPSKFTVGWLPSGCLAKGLQCSGSYCDDVKLIGKCCLGRMDIEWYWTNFFSEEKRAPVMCKRDHFLAGIRCTGSYCDNISLFCTKYKADTGEKKTWGHCSPAPSPWISEEGTGTAMIQTNGYYIVGVECSGSYCDKKRFYTCRMQ